MRNKIFFWPLPLINYLQSAYHYIFKKRQIHPTVKIILSNIERGVKIYEKSVIIFSHLQKNVRISSYNYIFSSKIGKYSYTSKNVNITNCEIGNYCCISANVCIGLSYHNHKSLSMYPLGKIMKFTSKRELIQSYNTGNKYTIIGHGVWIGAGALIKGGVKIGDGAVIGAGAVVTKDIPPYAIAVGVPARVIKYRFPEKMIKKLRKIKWWELDKEYLEKEPLLSILTTDVDKLMKKIPYLKILNEFKKHVT